MARKSILEQPKTVEWMRKTLTGRRYAVDFKVDMSMRYANRSGLLPFVTALVVSLAAPGCGGSEGGFMDTSTDGDPDGPGRGTITLVADDPLNLFHREEITIHGTYSDSTGALASTYVEASLQGTAHDATLNATTVLAGEDGAFSFTLTAPEVDATFVFRVEAEDGAEDDIDVVVSTVATDSLELDATYEGRRRIDIYLAESSLGETSECPDMTGEVLTSHETDDDSLPFEVGLPESTSLALALSGKWCEEPGSCHAWVYGCADGIVLDEGTDDSLTFDLEDDLSFFASPHFQVLLDIDASTSGGAWVDALIGPLTDMSSRDDDPGHFLLDRIYERIVVAFGTSQGDLFVGARISGNLDSNINASLVAAGKDFEGDIESLRTHLLGRFHPLSLEGILEGDFWGEVDQPAVNEIERLGGAYAASILEADPAAGEVNVIYEHDLVTLGSYSLPVGLGEALVGIMQEAVLPDILALPPPVTLEQFLEISIDCLVVALVIAGDSTAASIPPSEPTLWYQDTCTQVLAEAAEAVRAEADVLDSTHPGLVLAGGCDFLLESAARPARDCVGTLTSVSWGEETLVGDHVLRLEMP